MNNHIDTLKKTRTFLLSIIDGLSTEQLNFIPEGFSNNIIWNFAHLIAAQQGICYKRPGLPLVVQDSFFDSFKPGSKPEGTVTEEEITEIKSLALSTVDQLEKDYDDNLFGNYPSWTTRYGVEVNSIDDGLHFISFHEGMHTGYIMALKRALAYQLA